MNSTILGNAVRFLFFILIQVIVLKSVSIDINWLEKGMFFIYPLFLILLPINIPRPLLILAGFITGLTVDIFYDSLGVHAATAVLVSYIRMYVLRVYQPAQGYKTEGSPSAFNYGFPWFLAYSATMLIIFLFTYFSISYFSFVYILNIILSTIISFFFTMFLFIVHQLIFKTR